LKLFLLSPLLARRAPKVTVRGLFEAHAAFAGRNLRCLGVPDADVDDALQEVFVVVHRRLDDYDPKVAPRSWIYGICVRVASNHRRSLRRRREKLTDDLSRESVDAPQERITARKRARDRALSALESLDEGQRQVFVLFEIEHMDMKELAQMLGLPLQTAYSRLYAARKKLREVLEQAGHGAKECA
jgi:RNA polymerase sigma-70 factor (ECF subfamily)